MTPQRAGVLAVDIGGTKMAAAIVMADGSIVRRDRIATPQREPWTALSALVRRIHASAGEVDVRACGVACGGPMSRNGEQVSPLHIPSWREFPLRSSLAELTGLPTFVDNDAKALALAEGWLGAARDVHDFIAVVVGTGVGAGLVSAGRLIDGRLGNAGHLGHMIVEVDGRECRCGAKGCLEAYLAGYAIEMETGRGATYANAALIERNGRLLGRALAGAAALCDIRMAVVSGGVAHGWGDPFFAAATLEFEQRSRLNFTKGFEIRPAGLGGNSTLVGAAAVAFVRQRSSGINRSSGDTAPK